MARIRSVKPEYWLDRKLARSVSRDARLLYIGLWNYADEHGRMHGDPSVIKGQVFPYDALDVDPLLDELSAGGWVERYEYESDPYLFLPKLAKHQRLEPAKAKSRLPEPPNPGGGRSAVDSEKTVAESEQPAAESEPIVAQQVASGRLQGAGGKEQGASGSGPREAAAAELREAMSRAKIDVSWDVTHDQAAAIHAAIDRCGIPALVKQAQSRYQPDRPAFSVKAFIDGWSTLQGKPPPLELVPDPCEHGEGFRSRCALCRAAS